ncbi:MAG TPA: phosphotransferase [Ktedonobacteraceae bacterium]|nr:phosphotransferase [Ktedonobacteraceae bacterium]
MHICLIIDNPETPHHPILSSVVQQLSAAHTVRILDVRGRTSVETLAEEAQHIQADLYLLKSHAPQALDVAQTLEQRGALVVNSRAATLACQDRVLLSQRMEKAGLPWPSSQTFPSLARLLEPYDLLAALPFPLIVKSRYSRRGDLVAKVDNGEQLRAFAPQWSEEPIVLQQFMAGDGWDIKMWVIDGRIFAARRRTPLAGEGKKDCPIAPGELPTTWTHIAREIGRAFQLRLYGVDLLVTATGPVIVDVNSFPGFRGVPGAAEALVQLVERIAAGHAEQQIQENRAAAANLSINDLPKLAIQLFEQARLPLLPGAQGQVGLFARYLRRKPGRGLAVVYHMDEQQPGGKREQALEQAVSLTLEESALDGAAIRFSLEQAQQAALRVTATGIVQASTLGLVIQAFPADSGLPMLAACCDTSPQGQLWPALERAAWQQTGDPQWRHVAASAQPVRYKPGSRCVIRYQLTVEKQQEGKVIQKIVLLYGKAYADIEQAHNVQALMQALYAEQLSGQELPLLPAPLGISDIAGLVFNEAVQPPEAGEDKPENRVRTGNECFRFQVEYGRGGAVSRIIVPKEELCLTARALARLHTSSVLPGKKRTGAQEARRASERAAVLAGHSPQQAGTVLQLARKLATALEEQQPERYRPAHGGFKASQLLFHSNSVFVVDFDGFCLADPALDIGYFLAYLRPASLWYHRSGTREWFETSAALFVGAYREAMSRRGVDAQEIESCLARAKLYEAALLFKIATRRAHRLNSPRPGELAAMLEEVASCLSGQER